MRANREETLREEDFPRKFRILCPVIRMFNTECICNCGFSFQERFQETEAIKAGDPQGFYVGCPRCGEEA